MSFAKVTRYVFVHIVDDAVAIGKERQTDGEKFGIVKVIHVGSKGTRASQESGTRGEEPLQTVRGRRKAQDAHAANGLIASVNRYQCDVITSRRECDAFLLKNTMVEWIMNRR